MRTCLFATTLLAAFAAIPPAVATASDSPVVQAKVIEYAKEQGIVALDAGSRQGVSVGDRYWLFSDAGVIGTGEIFLVTATKSAGRWSGNTQTIAAGQTAVVLRRSTLAELRSHMPPGATISGTVLRSPPGRQTAWIDLATRSGMRVGDQVLVSRKGLPISRGRIKILDEATALTTLEPLVSNALPEPGDRVELWPAPSDARWGRLNSTVLRVSEGAKGTLDPIVIDLAGTGGDGMAPDRLVDVYRGRQYIGTGQIEDVAYPNSRARMMEVATATRPVEGDRAVVRASPVSPPGPLIAPVFKVMPDNVSITAGELDGVREGDTFLVRRQDPADPTVWHEVALLTVDYVAPAKCDAKIKPLTSQVEGVRVWDMAERQVTGVEQWRAVGIVEAVDTATRTAGASVEPNCPLTPGSVVAWIPEGEAPPGAAIVLRRDNDRLIIQVPPGWGDLKLLPRARIDATQVKP